MHAAAQEFGGFCVLWGGCDAAHPSCSKPGHLGGLAVWGWCRWEWRWGMRKVLECIGTALVL